MTAIVRVRLDRINVVVLMLRVMELRVRIISVLSRLVIVDGEPEAFSSLLREPVDGIEGVEFVKEEVSQ